MIDEKTKLRNALMEELYQKLSDYLANIATYHIATEKLKSAFSELSCSIETGTDQTSFIIPIKGTIFRIDLYMTEREDYLLNITPPAQTDHIDLQISMTRACLDLLTKK